MEEKEYLYSIRFLRGRTADCALCGASIGPGVVGFRDREVLCNPCLLRGSAELGLVMMLVVMARACARGLRRNPDDPAFFKELMTMARLLDDRFTKKGYPLRFPGGVSR